MGPRLPPGSDDRGSLPRAQVLAGLTPVTSSVLAPEQQHFFSQVFGSPSEVWLVYTWAGQMTSSVGELSGVAHQLRSRLTSQA